MAEAGRKVRFGFVPANPVEGIADFYILFWQDENQDGKYQTGEMPHAGEILYLDPGLSGGGYSADIVTGQFFSQTDSGGETVANLGNSCGKVTITIPDGWQLPPLSDDKQQYKTDYQPGRTNIFLGVIPVE